jgi:hypothetical protein
VTVNIPEKVTRSARPKECSRESGLDGRWLILDNRRSELMEGSDARSLTPLFAGEVEAVPAAASNEDPGEWNGQEASNDSISQLSSLQLLM